MVKILEKHHINSIRLKNRVVMEPMCMYSATGHDGVATDFHYTHYVSRAIGQVGLIIMEATGISPEGRISDLCLGLWNEEQKNALKKIVDGVHAQGGKIIIQLNHAGRKCTATSEVNTIYAPSDIAFSTEYRTPQTLNESEIQGVIKDFVNSTKLALEAGFDGIEIHAAHGYLLSQFMSPHSNKRTDKYKNGAVILNELTTALKEFWPQNKILSIRFSTTDYSDNGLDIDSTIQQIKNIASSYDLINISSGGITTQSPDNIYPGYQVNHAIKIKNELNSTVIACGLLGDYDLATFLTESGQVDYIGLARPLLENPNWVLSLYAKHNQKDAITRQYQRAY